MLHACKLDKFEFELIGPLDLIVFGLSLCLCRAELIWWLVRTHHALLVSWCNAIAHKVLNRRNLEINSRVAHSRVRAQHVEWLQYVLCSHMCLEVASPLIIN